MYNINRKIRRPSGGDRGYEHPHENEIGHDRRRLRQHSPRDPGGARLFESRAAGGGVDRATALGDPSAFGIGSDPGVGSVAPDVPSTPDGRGDSGPPRGQGAGGTDTVEERSPGRRGEADRQGEVNRREVS